MYVVMNIFKFKKKIRCERRMRTVEQKRVFLLTKKLGMYIFVTTINLNWRIEKRKY